MMVTSEPISLYEILRQHSQQTPEALAILGPGKAPISYRRLVDQIETTVLRLNRWGFGEGDRIALALPNGPEMLAAYVAISSACGCAPLNPAYRVNEIVSSLSDTRARALVVQHATLPPAREAARQVGIPVIDLVPDATFAGLFGLDCDLPEDPSIAEPVFAGLDAVALILLTSGTTSRSKVVPITHRNIYHSVQNANLALELTPADRCLNIMPLFHIHGLVAVSLTSLAHGASIVCTPGFSSYQVMDWLVEFSPTWYSAVPSLHQAVLDQALQQPEKAKAAHLRFTRSSSSALSSQLAQGLEAVFNAPVRDVLGMTESTGAITNVRLPPPPGKEGTVGIPQGTSRLRAMDEDGNILPPNEIGELCLSGEVIIRGYENNPEANAAAFKNGWLRMGDLGYVDEDGYVFIKGRIKEIINRGGVKISPQEVDDVLAQHPAVKQAAAFAVPHPLLGEDVAAAVVLQDGKAASMQELRQFVAARLADFKAPRQIIFVKEIPKGAAGKIQRVGMAGKFQAELAALRERETGEAAEPLTEVEAVIQSIWQAVLGLDHVGMHDDYLVMGGDSIRAAIILMNVNERFGTNLLLGDIFDTPTVATMAAVVQARLANTQQELTLPLIQAQRQREAPLSPAQTSLWLIQQIAPDTVAYNFCFIFKLSGSLDRQALERAVNELVLRHESLRTIYPSRAETPYQLILPFEPFPLPLVDFSGLPVEERQAAIHHYAAEHENLPFDLSREASERFALLYASPEEHYLYFCVHHINWDAWSHFVFTGDLMALYGACRAGEQPDLPALDIQYSDYASAYVEWMQGETLSAFLEHWKKTLTGDMPRLELPTDRPRPARQTDHGARDHYTFSPALSTRIKDFCRSERMTPFHLLAGAYALLLGRYSGQTEIIFGCPFANRPRPEQHRLIGLFTNVLPLRLDLSGNPTARELFQQARAAMLAAFTWQALPFRMLVNELAPQRDLSRTPIYNVAINMINVPRRPTVVPGLELSEVRRDDMPAQFDLTFEFAEESGNFSGSVIYNIDLYDRSTIARMAAHFVNLLEGMLSEPDRSITEVDILSEAEHQQILVEWNNTASQYPRERCLHELFEAQVELRPDALAVQDRTQGLSYQRLNARANRIAHRLRKMGAGPDKPIGLYLDRSADLVTAILGILKSGSPYVPMDIIYPAERRAEVIRDSGMQILVTQHALASSELPVGLELLVLDWDAEGLALESEHNPALIGHPENLIYMIYTSGSTGKPKGVEITHRSVVNCLLSAQERTGLSAGDFSLTVTTPTFDISAFEMLLPVCIGGAVFVGSRDELHDSSLLAQRIAELPLTWMCATPVIWRMLVETGWPGKRGLKILCSGEPMPPDLANRLMETCGELYNLYGPTETTIWCTISRLQPGRPVTIGRPIANTRVYILDAKHNPTPVGVPGELYIAGDGLARGYHNHPELTAEAFISGAAFPRPEERLYRTGDIVRWLPDGSIDFLGRADGQVKLRGFRIELGEIETLLRQHPAVQDALVMLREDRPGDRRLVGYVTLAQQARLEPLELRVYLKDKLPVYMVPAAFVFIDAFVLTSSGKIDRKALPAPEPGSLLQRAYIPPQSLAEQTLAKIWMEVLGLPRVGRQDDFFELGGNSLSAVQVMARLRPELNVRLPIYAIFTASCLADLAGQVELALGQRPARAAEESPSGERERFVL